MQKILEDANVKLGNILSDVFGVSGQLMLAGPVTDAFRCIGGL